jgi:hypothetical protein
MQEPTSRIRLVRSYQAAIQRVLRKLERNLYSKPKGKNNRGKANQRQAFDAQFSFHLCKGIRACFVLLQASTAEISERKDACVEAVKQRLAVLCGILQCSFLRTPKVEFVQLPL